MTGIVIALLIALLTGGAILAFARMPLGRLAPLATALLLGLAGYAWQGQPALMGKPVKASGEARFDEALAEKRKEIGERISSATKWLVISDGLARQGDTQNAANILQSGLRETPNDPNLWVGMGNALLVHGDGALSPAATFAYEKALAIDPKGISARYFYGLALAQSAQFEQAKEQWGRLAAQLPEDAALREELIRNIALVDALMKRRDAMAQGGNPAP